MESDGVFEAHTEFAAYENAQPPDEPEGGVWCSSSQAEIARLKQHFDDLINIPVEAPLEAFFALLNDLRNLYCIDASGLKDEALESNDIFWAKAAISFMEALLQVRNGIAEIRPGIIPTRLASFY